MGHALHEAPHSTRPAPWLQGWSELGPRPSLHAGASLQGCLMEHCSVPHATSSTMALGPAHALQAAQVPEVPTHGAQGVWPGPSPAGAAWAQELAQGRCYMLHPADTCVLALVQPELDWPQSQCAGSSHIQYVSCMSDTLGPNQDHPFSYPIS